MILKREDVDLRHDTSVNYLKIQCNNKLTLFPLQFNYLLFVHAIQQKSMLLTLGKSKEAEVKRINKELANIRSKFKGKFLCCKLSLFG